MSTSRLKVRGDIAEVDTANYNIIMRILMMMAVILLIMAMITLRHFTLITKLICASTFTVKATTFTHSRTSLSLTNLVNKASKAAEQVLRCDNHLNQVALPTLVVHQVGD